MENKAYALAAGIFVVVMSVAMAVAVWWFRQDHTAVSHYILETRKTVGGLNKEAVVRYRGIRAGKVEDIDVDPNDPRVLLVKINLDKDFKLTQGTTASLGMQGITGLAFISLEDDGSKPEPLTAPPGSPPGTLPRIPLRPSFFESISENAGDTLRNINTATARLEKVLSEKNLANLERTLDNVATASEGLKELPQVMASLRTALSPENIKRFHDTLANIEKASGQAAPLAQEARQLVTQLNVLAVRAEALLGGEHESGQVPGARSTLLRANQMLDEVSQAARNLSRLANRLESAPNSLIFGAPPPPPGPGEAGFAAGEQP